MSDVYRVYGDGWSKGADSTDQSADVSKEYSAMMEMMTDIQSMMKSSGGALNLTSEFLMEAMAEVVYESNLKAQRGMGLDETIVFCMVIFKGQGDIEFNERSEEYQKRLDKLIPQDLALGERHVVRSRREVVQHAMAFQHIVNKFVKEERNLTEDLIKETHAILVKGSRGEDAGITGTKEYGGIYRNTDVYIGTHCFPPPARIRASMRSFVTGLANELEEGVRTGRLDPIAIGAKYCDMFVNIHPFRDGNGRMCRLILNAILLRYAGVVVNVAEHRSRDEYLATALESTEVGGHPGALATLVLRHATNTYRKMRKTVRGKLRLTEGSGSAA